MTDTAWVTVRERWKLVPTSSMYRRRQKVHTGREYLRWAKCPLHSKTTNDFLGVGDGLWVFICTPVGRRNRDCHTFSVQPPLHDIITPPAQPTGDDAA